MVDLTKPVAITQRVIQNTVSQVQNPKTAEAAEDAAIKAAAKLAHELKLVGVIAECAEARGRANVPDYVLQTIHNLRG